MKTAQVLLTVFLGLFFSEIAAQQPNVLKQKVNNKVWVILDDKTPQIQRQFTIDTKYTIDGAILRTNDSSIVISKNTKWYHQNIATEELAVTKILKIQTPRFPNTVRGTFIGMGLGAFLGFVIAQQSVKKSCNDDPGGYECALDGPTVVGGIFAVLGMAVGGSIGGTVTLAIRRTFTIEGSYSLYSEQREKLKKISITGQ